MRRRVAASADLGDDATLKFKFVESGVAKEAFVVRRNGRVHAYRNECRHIAMTMDWVENRFLSRDKCFIQCATHGALYKIDSGLCVSGPPAGERLRALEVHEEDDAIFVELPD